jgi:hypothetical protein
VAGFTVPGLLTISSIGPQYTAMFRHVAKAALASGKYKRLVVPGCGTFHIVHQAQQAGWKPEQMEASDIALLSGLMGYYINQRPLDDLAIQIKGFEDEDLSDGPTVAYLQLLARYETKAHIYYWREVAIHLRAIREQAIAEIRIQFDRARGMLAGIDYRLQDFWEHLAEVLDDPETIVLMNPPCVKAGYEHFYDDKGRVSWNEPNFRVFDMAKEMKDLAALMCQGNALCLVLEEAEPGQPSMDPVYAKASTRRSPHDPFGVRTMNSYFTTNQPEALEALLGQRLAGRKPSAKAAPANFRVLPHDHVITAESSIGVVKLEPSQGLYYRLLWTHRFMPGAGAERDYAVIVDGYLTAIFGFNTAWLRAGRWGDLSEDNIILAHYGMGVPGHPRRLMRLVNRLMICRDTIERCVDHLLVNQITRVRTAQFTRHPESKDKRGMYELTKRTVLPHNGGFSLIYEADVIHESVEDAFAWWLRDEQRYMANTAGGKRDKRERRNKRERPLEAVA